MASTDIPDHVLGNCGRYCSYWHAMNGIHTYSASRLGDIVQLLLSRGADPNASSIPLPPMFYAVLVGDVAVTKKLLECGGRADDCLPGKVYNSRDS